MKKEISLLYLLSLVRLVWTRGSMTLPAGGFMSQTNHTHHKIAYYTVRYNSIEKKGERKEERKRKD